MDESYEGNAAGHVSQIGTFVGQPHHGARLSTVPYGPLPVPDAPETTPFDLLMIRLTDVENFAQEHKFYNAVQGLRNLRAALAYNKRIDEEAAKANANAKGKR